MSELSAGAATVDISPPEGIRLSGFAGRPTGNTGCRDPIRVGALYLSDGDGAAVILALDIIGLHPQDDARLRAAVAEAVDVSIDAVLAACSHTHSGPATMEIRATGAIEREWTETVIRRAVEAAGQAREAAVPASASHGAGYSFANINRRLPTNRGIALAPYPGGPCDPICRVLLLESGEAPTAVIVQYEMHPVMLGSGNLQVSADWVGHTRERIERVLGCPSLFLQGCCGDINPRLRGDEGECEALGLDVAGSALTALRRLHPLEAPRLSWGSSDAVIPVRPLPGRSELAQIEREAEEAIRSHDAGASSLSSLHLAEADRDWARACLAFSEPPDEVIGRVSALNVGGLTLVGLPGEIFTSIGDRVRTAVPGSWAIGYANGNLGYLYPDDALAAGGYEVDVAFRLYGELQAGEGTADSLVASAAEAARNAA